MQTLFFAAGALAVITDFSDALLLGADFTNAYLSGANFSNAGHLKATQLVKARNLHGARLSDRLKEEMLALNPSLFDREPTGSHRAGFGEMLDERQLAEEPAQAWRRHHGLRSEHGPSDA